MADYSLVPVDYQPEFESYSLVPVDYDPFGDSGGIQQAPAQPQPTVQSPPTQPQVQQPQIPTQPARPVPQTQPQQPATIAGQPGVNESATGNVPGGSGGGVGVTQQVQTTPTVPGGSAAEGGSGSPFVEFFNQLAAPERAESERVADLVQSHPTAAKIEGAIGLGSLLLPPLVMMGAEGLGLVGAAEGLAGPAVSGLGRATAASTVARRAVDEAMATLPKGMTRKNFQDLAGFEQGLAASRQASTEATAEMISKLKSAGISSQSIAAFQKIYEGIARENPSNLSAVHRAALLANILRSFQ